MPRSKRDESTLPKWAQDELRALRGLINAMKEDMEQMQRAKAVLDNRSQWFTLPGPPADAFAKGKEYTHLWFLTPNNPFPVCDLGPGDVLLVGRANNQWRPFWLKDAEDIAAIAASESRT